MHAAQVFVICSLADMCLICIIFISSLLLYKSRILHECVEERSCLKILLHFYHLKRFPYTDSLIRSQAIGYGIWNLFIYCTEHWMFYFLTKCLNKLFMSYLQVVFDKFDEISLYFTVHTWTIWNYNFSFKNLSDEKRFLIYSIHQHHHK